jgi:hypothetical protein
VSDQSHLSWPFFEGRHRQLAARLEDWAHAHLRDHEHGDVDEQCRSLVRCLGEGGWLRYAVGGTAWG